MSKYENFRTQLESMINSNSMENGSGTPDFILSQYLTRCLENYDKTVKDRESWYDRGVNGIGGDSELFGTNVNDV